MTTNVTTKELFRFNNPYTENFPYLRFSLTGKSIIITPVLPEHFPVKGIQRSALQKNSACAMFCVAKVGPEVKDVKVGSIIIPSTIAIDSIDPAMKYFLIDEDDVRLHASQQQLEDT